jgi:putative ABC transport system permease protein
LYLAVRRLLTNLRFTAVIVLTLALGIGANTAVFTLLDSVLWRPLPLHDPARLVNLYATDDKNTQSNFRLLPISYLNYRDIRDTNDLFTGLAAFLAHQMTLANVGNEPRRISVQLVTDNYFALLGVRPVRGRTFSSDEAGEAGGGKPVAVLSYSAWVNLYAADPNVIDQSIRLDAQQYKVIGVMPREFKGTMSLAGAEQIWLPLAHSDQILTGQMRDFLKTRRGLFLGAFGRLEPNVTLRQAHAAVATIAARLAQDHPGANRGRSLTVASLNDAALGINQRGQAVQAGTVLMIIVGLVLLITCVNLANLLIARAAAREKEMGIRAALGASREQLVRQLLAEYAILSVAGGLAGLLVAFWLLRLLWSLRPPFLPVDALVIALNWRMLTFSGGLVIVATLAIGLIPAARATRAQVRGALDQGSRGATNESGRMRWHEVLVVVELALALVVLICAGVFLRSLQQSRQIDPGFETKKLFVFAFDLGTERYDAERGQQFYSSVIERVRETPGVAAAAFGSNIPFGLGTVARTVYPEGHQAGPGEPPLMAIVNITSPGYFETLRLRLRHGRVLNDFDRPHTEAVAVVNEATAERFWPGRDAIGQRILLHGDKTSRQIVGVVSNSTQLQLGEPPQPVLYLALRQTYTPFVCLYVRTAGDPEAALPVVRRAVQEMDPRIALTDSGTLPELINRNLWAAHAGAALLSAFAVIALFLAAVGTYGVMADAVTRRTQEMGIRIALGARPADIWTLVLVRGLVLTAAGIGTGLMLALLVVRAADTLLYGIHALDPVTFAGVPILLAIVAMAACVIPARRATRVDPLLPLKGA